MNQLHVIDVADPAWDGWIESTTHDVYHTAGYHRVAESIDEGTPVLLVFGEPDHFVAWPYLLQGIPDASDLIGGPAHDVTSTYGYSGPIVRGCDLGDPLIDEAWEAFREHWHEQHVISLFTRFHPILRNDQWFTGCSSGLNPDRPAVVLTGETVSIDLTRPDGEIVAAYPRKFRQEIAQSRRLGFTTSVDAGWAHLDKFIELYSETMARNRARSSYFLKRNYFDKLTDELGSDVILFVGTVGPEVAAACIFLSHHGILHPHLAGTSTTFLPLSPLKVMWDEVRRWAADRGDRIMHLGGGRGGSNDSLFSFKARFSDRRHAFYTGRWILDPKRYEVLVRETQGSVDPESGHFPSYRAPRELE